MSMLAERKRKQKWSLNPRGKAWAQDSSKFGQKLLEKMGWSQGKGLGANEDGRTEHIKVSYKNDSQGMGYKESDNQWSEHESKFSALLTTLGGGEQKHTETQLSSLEKKSEKSRVRVHYKKFTRGKDLSRYSETDLANIFGKKSMKEMKVVKKELQHELEIIEQEINEYEKDKNFSNAGLMSEYFKKKLPNFGKTSDYIIGSNGVLRKSNDSESENEERPSFVSGLRQNDREEKNTTHFLVSLRKQDESQTQNATGEKIVRNGSKSTKEKSTFLSYIDESDINKISSKKKKEKKKRSLEHDLNIAATPTKRKKIEAQELSKNNAGNKKNDKMKKKIKGDVGLSNPAFDPLQHTSLNIEKHFLDPIEESLNESINTINSSISDIVSQVAKQFEVQVQILSENTPVKRSEDIFGGNVLSKKKKKKDNIGCVDKSFEDEETSNINLSINRTVQVRKKNKESKVSKVDIHKLDMSISNDTIEDSTARPNYVIRTEKEKERQLKTCNFENIPTISDNYDVQHTTSKKKKTKSKRSEKGTDNPFFDTSIESSTCTQTPTSSFTQTFKSSCTQTPYEVKTEAKKKKKGSKNKGSDGVPNPVFNGGDVANAQDFINEAYEVKRKNKKHHKNKENEGIENPIFNGEDIAGPQDYTNDEFEVKRKDKRKTKDKKELESKGLDNPALNLNDTIEEPCDLMLNVVSTPVQAVQNQNTPARSGSIQKIRDIARRKSVRFSDITRERIIPNKEEIANETPDDSRDIVEIEGKLNDSSDLTYIDKFIQKKKAKKRKKGLDNVAFDQQANEIEENITSITKTLDTFEAEIDNDINEAKMKSVEIDDIMVGEVGNPEGTNMKLPDGSVKLKFKYANFKKTSKYLESLTGAKKSYKHLIKGDIVMGFKESNLHEIQGYAVVNGI